MEHSKATILFSHDTALGYWRGCVRAPRGSNPRSSEARSADRRARRILRERLAPDPREADLFRLTCLSQDGPRAPFAHEAGLAAMSSARLHAVGRAHSRKFEQCGMQRHMFSPGSPDFERLPSGLYVPVDEGFLVASPALCFLQLSEGMSVPQSVLLGLEMCGVFASSSASANASDNASGSAANNASGIASGSAVRDAPLASPSDLRRTVDSLPGARGRKIAARALRFVASGSASPMESVLCTMLALPYSLGGCSLPVPELNYRIDIPPAQRSVFGKSYFLCDLYWPDSRVCVEYDSDAFHTGSERIARDSKRRNALLSLGVTVVTVTRRQIMSDIEMDEVARTVARLLGRRFRPPARHWERRAALRAELRSALSS